MAQFRRSAIRPQFTPRELKEIEIMMITLVSKKKNAPRN
jgi:hypothetical protein